MFREFTGNAAEEIRNVTNRVSSSRQVLRAAFTALIAAVLLCAVCAVAAAETKYSIDPAKSQVQFSLGGFHEVNGFFQVASGDIAFDRKTGAMTGSIVVEAGTGNSGDSARDKKMKGDELHAAKFPTITFAPTQFTGILNNSGESTIQVHGTFTLIGKAHPIVVPMTVTIHGNQCTATGSFVIPYVNWGIKDPTMMFMKEAKDVTIDLTFTGTLTH